MDEAIRQAIELTHQLIQIPSESSGQTASSADAPEKGVEQRLLEFAAKNGLDANLMPVTDRRNNVIVRFPGKGPRLLIAGHMDTVSAKGMSDPFNAALRSGRIYGRGACDDKGPIACALAVLAWIRSKGLVPVFDLTFAATVDEECTLAGAEALAARIGPFDLCLALEPTELKIVCAHKGNLRLQITTRGRAAHSSSPEKGLNAIDNMLPVLETLQRFKQKIEQQPAHPLCGRPTLSCTSLHAGSSSNIIPEDCILTVDIRLRPETNPDDIYAELRALLPAQTEIRLLFAGKGIETDHTLAHIRKLSAIISAAGLAPGPAAVSYATDCCRLAQRGPCVVWGPGNIEQAHHREEFIQTEQIAQAVGILRQFLCDK